MQATAFGDKVVRASDLTAERTGRGSDRFLPVDERLRPLLPGGGLRRGSVIGISAATGATSLMFTLLAEASRAGSWCAVVGMPNLGWVAADEAGVVLKRTAIVPDAGRDWTAPVAALVDGFDVVVVATSERVSAATCRQVAARARQRGAVLVPFATAWDGVEVTLTVIDALWDGVGEGAGRRVMIRSKGRGAAATGRRAEVWMPASSGWRPESAETADPRPGLRAVG